ncbi:sn-glycerol-3-phosphate ABC transporter ATP-binding protein UgpC [Halomonas sp. 18H]|uniref:sn-glycerol-3-phosphate ABC transporter ATP-binding protein UgpC n=1 Tax=Halomonas almeriensis TaxID=308163 RepID=UPI00222F4459|nr:MULTISPECIES: sn-glycerol-3-phosphate ABC transporter ATP-binding protein UgpC [Halomonas]MCW4152806.1 sn-glycerol-3-phosphate ABC transporter ATP-binding protein UgpC [Halomonas sp. 18H]MDN3551995.1 sn-glycerol-3-phosphate ABC transporter ATP-binding protein UgpC [Halomonas almeriensis]
MGHLNLQGIGKEFDGVEVSRDIDLTIEDGEFVVFVGPSGCGKSTLLRMIAGLETISEGEMSLDGERINDIPPQERDIGMVFQSYALYPHLTVAENMAFGLKLARVSKSEIKERVQAASDILHLNELLERKPKDLSGGQRQRVAIGRTLVKEPAVFLFDEPLSNLDAALRVDMRVQIAELHKRLGATMIYVTHDQVEAMTLADRIVLLSGGRIAQVGAPLSLYHFPRTLEVAEFIGSPRINTLEVTVSEPGSDRTLVRLPNGEPLQVHVDGSRLNTGDTATLGVRAEDFVPGEDAEAVLEARLLVAEKLGYETLAHLTVEGITNTLTQRLGGLTPLEDGQWITLGLDGRHCHLFDQAGAACPRNAEIPGVPN